jgi:two-component system sensor histidine kinase YesM
MLKVIRRKGNGLYGHSLDDLIVVALSLLISAPIWKFIFTNAFNSLYNTTHPILFSDANDSNSYGGGIMFRNNIRNKLFLFMFLAIVLPALSSITITYFYTKHSLKSESIHENERLLYQIKMNTSSYMTKINEASLSVYLESSKYTPGIYSIMRYGGTDFSTVNEIYRSLQALLHFDDGIYQVHLYSKNDHKSYLMANEVMKTVGEVIDPFDHADANAGSVIVEPMHKSGSYGKTGLPYVEQKDVISFHRKLYLQPNTIPLGVISFDIKQDVFSRMINDMQEDNSKIIIVDGKGQTIFDPEHEFAAMGGSKSALFKTMTHVGDERGQIEYTFKQTNGIMLFERVKNDYLDWYIVKQISYSELYQKAKTLTLINGSVLGLFLVIAVLITFILSTRFTEPIKRLIRTINAVENGNLKVRIETDKTDEIGILSKRFSQMIDTIDRLVVQEYKWKLATKINQLKALQAQINPHFLNNALQSIATLALYSKQNAIYKLITSLGKMMDYHMDTSEETAELSREIEHVKSYLDLQKQRFERLEIEIDFDPNAGSILVPKMILQPLVENYFKHGADPRQNGMIKINCLIRSNDILEISVLDNGKGMAAESIAALQTQLDEAWKLEDTLYNSNHIGLINVYTRLKLFFGDSASMRVGGNSPSGFQVTIIIPYNDVGRLTPR